MFYLLVIIFGVLPVYLLKTEIFGIPTTALELLTYAAAVLVGVRWLTDKQFKTQINTKLKWLWQEKKSFLLVVGFFMLAAWLATIFTEDLRRSLGILKGWYFDPVLAALLIFVLARDKFDFYKVITALSFMAAALSTYGIYDLFSFPWPRPEVDQRLDSIFTSPNYHALLIGPIIILTLSILLDKDLWHRRFLPPVLIPATVVNLIALYYTQSYGGFLGVFLAVIFMFIVLFAGGRIKKKTAYASLAVLVFAVAALVNVITASEKFQRDFYNREGLSSLRGRYEVWQTGIFIIKEHPVFGLGLGNYDVGYKRYVHQAINGEPLEPVMIHAHNIILDFWTDSGIIGLAAFIVLLVYFFKTFWRAYKFEPFLALAAGAAMVAVLGHGLLDTPYFKNDLSYLFWLIVVIPLFLEYRYGKQSTESQR